MAVRAQSKRKHAPPHSYSPFSQPQSGMKIALHLGRGARHATRSPRAGATTGGLLLWAGTTSIGVSTVIILAVLSHHYRHGYSGLSTLFSLFFLASLIPSGVPLRAAALAVDGAKPPRLTATHLTSLILAGVIVTPAVAFALHLPVLAVVFVWGQVIVAIHLAIRRGPLIASRRFSALGANLFLEAVTRVVLCIGGGLLWGMPGLSAGLLGGTAMAWATVPGRSTINEVRQRPMTTMFDTWVALALLGLFVQLDILLAPSGLSKEAATHYDLAAVPSKGVYLVLAAASTFIFPYVRVRAQRRTVVTAALVTGGLGVVVTATLVPLRHLIGQILGQHPATPFLLISLGVAMSIGGATGIIVNGGVALGVARLWPPLLPGIAGLLIAWALRPSADVFAAVFLGTQAGTLLISIWFCLGKRRTAKRPPGEASEPDGLPAQPGTLGVVPTPGAA